MSRSLHDECVFIGIPQEICGSQIKPGTVNILYESYHLLDDSNGNLYDINNSNTYVGNIFYTAGNIILTNTSSYIDDFDTGSFTAITFRGTHKIYEREITCEINKGEYTMTTNPTIFRGYFDSASRSLVGSSLPLTKILSSSYFDPYITTIGLYNEDYQLLVVGKLARPIKNDKDVDLVFTLRIDT